MSSTDILDPKPDPADESRCVRCGGKYPGVGGLCGYCLGWLKLRAARVNGPDDARVPGTKAYRVVTG